MVIIFRKVLGFDMMKFFKETFLKITPALLIVMAFGICLEQFNPMNGGALRFVVNGALFLVLFVVLMVLFVMNKEEKNLVFGKFKKLIKR